MFSGANTRKTTNQILELVEEGVLDAKETLKACLCYMSESDVTDMAHCEELIPWFEQADSID